ncbi:MAG: S8 family serine peptidase [Verrucomicrobia bacterium]|nr:S8 family serine peptidase [Verrucomicrobiota bacterium]
MPRSTAQPQNYFLNENHQLDVGEKQGGGRFVDYLGISWPQKAKRLHDSLEKVERRARESNDPLSGRNYYILADPVAELVKASSAKDAIEGRKVEKVSFSGEQSKFFERVGLDLIEVHSSGAATVRASPERMEQLLTKTSQLAGLGAREQSRFVAFDAFEWLSGKLKFDREWLDQIGSKPVEGYIKLQPLISELEADLVIRALEEIFRRYPRLALRGKGRSYLGRFFLRATLDARMVKELAEDFTSIQSIHPPIIAFAESLPPEIGTAPRSRSTAPHTPVSALPCVGVVDTAVSQENVWLRSHRRAIVTGLNCSNTENDNHGSMVASRVVFGDADLSNGSPPPSASCRYLEVRVGTGREREILAESISGALAAAISAAPDVRVFNLSFDGNQRLDLLPDKQRAETLKHIEELDNFAFDQDVMIVVAAGNAVQGAVPAPGYPLHFDDPGWQLHSFPRAFNALTCGGTASRLSAGGLASETDAPSPFTRVGPGFAGSPKPDFCDSAGNTDANYRSLPGAGVWGFSGLGIAREDFGTSFAAPLLAREAAFVLDELRTKCPGDSRPFSCTAKAVLALTADDIAARLSDSLKPLAKRTIGFGRGSAARFRQPVSEKARFVWQGVIAHPDDIVRVQIPIPIGWIDLATAPQLHLCAAWDTPVCAAAERQWACRDVNVAIRPGPEARALHGSRGRTPGYPIFKRAWNLDKAREKNIIEGDMWILEFSYSQIAAYAAGHIVSPAQRVAIAAEIWDDAEVPLDPHSFVQSLPIAATFVRLSNTSVWLPQPITVSSNF